MSFPIELPIALLDSELPLPTAAKPGDAGIDLMSTETFDLVPGQRRSAPTGVAVAIPDGYAGFIVPRSGLAAHLGVTVLNAPGLIDSGYRGEIKVILVNHDWSWTRHVERGDRIAQLVISPVATAVLEVVDLGGLGVTERGDSGLGSTGRSGQPV